MRWEPCRHPGTSLQVILLLRLLRHRPPSNRFLGALTWLELNPTGESLGRVLIRIADKRPRRPGPTLQQRFRSAQHEECQIAAEADHIEAIAGPLPIRTWRGRSFFYRSCQPPTWTTMAR